MNERTHWYDCWKDRAHHDCALARIAELEEALRDLPRAMKASAELQKMNACTDALDWIGNRTIGQAWRDCRRSDWMLWLLHRIAPNDRRCRLAAADFAERVWHLILNEPTRLVAAWAIGAARRGDTDEMWAASASAYASASAHAAASAYAAASASYTAAYASYTAAYASAAAVASATSSVASYTASYTASAAASAASAASAAASFTAAHAASAPESAAQADILRGYFTESEIAKLFNVSAKEGER